MLVRGLYEAHTPVKERFPLSSHKDACSEIDSYTVELLELRNCKFPSRLPVSSLYKDARSDVDLSPGTEGSGKSTFIRQMQVKTKEVCYSGSFYIFN